MYIYIYTMYLYILYLLYIGKRPNKHMFFISPGEASRRSLDAHAATCRIWQSRPGPCDGRWKSGGSSAQHSCMALHGHG